MCGVRDIFWEASWPSWGVEEWDTPETPSLNRQLQSVQRMREPLDVKHAAVALSGFQRGVRQIKHRFGIGTPFYLLYLRRVYFLQTRTTPGTTLLSTIPL